MKERESTCGQNPMIFRIFAIPTELLAESPYIKAVNKISLQFQHFHIGIIFVRNFSINELKKNDATVLPSPPVNGVMPVKQLIAVVFPAPFGPSRQNN